MRRRCGGLCAPRDAEEPGRPGPRQPADGLRSGLSSLPGGRGRRPGRSGRTGLKNGQLRRRPRVRINRPAAHFESLGVEVVRADLATGGVVHIGGPYAKEAARRWLAEKDAERMADTRRDRRWQRIGVFLSGGTLLLSIVRVLGGVGVGLFFGWLLWVLL